MRTVVVLILIAIFLTLSAPASAQMVSGKAVMARSRPAAHRTVVKRDDRIEKNLGILSMIPVVITSETNIREKKNNVQVTITPTTINFGITF